MYLFSFLSFDLLLISPVFGMNEAFVGIYMNISSEFKSLLRGFWFLDENLEFPFVFALYV